MAFKTFTAGSVLTAADLNDYLMEQANIACTASTRPTGQNGMHIDETDTGVSYRHDGTSFRRKFGPLVQCRLRRAATQSISSGGSGTSISWDTQDLDTDAFWSSGATVTIPSDGTYTIVANASTTSVVNARHSVYITVTSALTGISGVYRVPAYGEDRAALTVTVPLSAGDTFTVGVYQASGGSLNYTANLVVTRHELGV